MKFRDYLKIESANIFGFDSDCDRDAMERSPNIPKNDIPETPLKRLNINYINDLLCQHKLGEKQPYRFFHDRISWGSDAGAVRLKFGTKSTPIIEKMNYNLFGDKVWIAKRVYDLNDECFVGKEESIADELLMALREVDLDDSYSPINNYPSFDRLVQIIADRTSKVANDPLFYEGATKSSENEYILKFGVKGQGVQGPDQKRVEQVHLHLCYHPKEGTIQAIQRNIESRLGRHDWLLTPSDHEFTFVPTQPTEEIINTLSTIMKFY